MTDDRDTHSLFPFLWDFYDIIETECIAYYVVTFTDDYGPIHKGESFSMALVDYEEGALKIYDLSEDTGEMIEDDPVMIIKFRCKPYDVWRKE